MTLREVGISDDTPELESVGGRRAPKCCQSTSDHVSDREVKILTFVASGLSNADIGRQLFISEATVRHYVTRWFRRTGASSRAELVARGIGIGLVRVDSWPPRATSLRCIPRLYKAAAGC